MSKSSSKGTTCSKLHVAKPCRSLGVLTRGSEQILIRNNTKSNISKEQTRFFCVSLCKETSVVLNRRSLHQPRWRSRARLAGEANKADLPAGQRSCRFVVSATFYNVCRQYCLEEVQNQNDRGLTKLPSRALKMAHHP